jgi:hypothetical protein
MISKTDANNAKNQMFYDGNKNLTKTYKFDEFERELDQTQRFNKLPSQKSYL